MDEVKESLDQAIGLEIEAIKVYDKSDDLAKQKGDGKTAEVFAHVNREERQHLREFVQRRAELAPIEGDGDLPQADLMLHALAHMHGSPGILVDPDLAKASACICYGNVCFTKGIVGALDPAQRETYCATPVQKGETERVRNWRDAVDVCKVNTKDLPKGEKLKEYLSCMGLELEKRGITP